MLRFAQNTKTVEDSTEWDNALSKPLHDLNELVFDFQDYDEDLEFHFLYRDATLLAAICNFGDVSRLQMKETLKYQVMMLRLLDRVET